MDQLMEYEYEDSVNGGLDITDGEYESAHQLFEDEVEDEDYEPDFEAILEARHPEDDVMIDMGVDWPIDH